jgi:hypothetical protein
MTWSQTVLLRSTLFVCSGTFNNTDSYPISHHILLVKSKSIHQHRLHFSVFTSSLKALTFHNQSPSLPATFTSTQTSLQILQSRCHHSRISIAISGSFMTLIHMTEDAIKYCVTIHQTVGNLPPRPCHCTGYLHHTNMT